MIHLSVHRSTVPGLRRAGWRITFGKKAHTCAIKTVLCFFACIITGSPLFAQHDTLNYIQPDISVHADQVSFHETGSGFITNQPGIPLTKKQINRRIKIVAAGNIVGYSVVMIGLNAAWYKGYPKSNLHSFNDLPEWKGMDKMGHVYSVYAESLASMELWRWTGISRKKRIWLGGLSGPVYHTAIEVLDGFSAEWGWSWSDIGANFIGSGMLIAQELAWDEQRIQLKLSFHRKNYSDPTLNERSNDIFGKSTAERFLKDYNGHTFWLCANMRSFFPESKWPRWLNLAAGTGAEGLFGANDNIDRDKNGVIIFDRTNMKRYRQWYFGPDIDLTKIKTNKKALKLAFRFLNIVKIPMPALEYSNGSFKVKAIGF